jgi:hypothetical protein
VERNKFEMVGYVIALLGFCLAFFFVNQTEQNFGNDAEVRYKTNQELHDAITQLEQKCNARSFVTKEDEFLIGSICSNSKSLRVELEHLRTKAEAAENEADGQFWLSVVVLGVLFCAGFLGIFKAIEWCIQSRTYQPILIKIPRTTPQVA